MINNKDEKKDLEIEELKASIEKLKAEKEKNTQVSTIIKIIIAIVLAYITVEVIFAYIRYNTIQEALQKLSN